MSSYTPRVRVLWCPHSGEPTYRVGFPKGFSGSECLAISENLTVLYNITQTTPNASLAGFGHILANIPGDAVIVYEKDDCERDIPTNTLDELPQILQRDTTARLNFRKTLAENGIHVISV